MRIAGNQISLRIGRMLPEDFRLETEQIIGKNK